MKMNVFGVLMFVCLLGTAAFAAGAQTLGNYPEVTVAVGGGKTILPANYPTGVARATAVTSSAFKGILTADPASGAVTVTNAQPAGNFTVIVRGFASGGASVSKTFTLRVLRQGCRDYSLSSNLAQFPASPLSTESEPYYNAVGDFNADGKQDLIVAGSAANKVSIFAGDGSGSFSGFAASPLAVSADRPGKIVVGDFNGDGRQDFAVSGKNNNKVAVYLGDGAGNFSEAGGSPISVCASPSSLTSADFNNDGKLDLAVACDTGQSISVLLGAGDGTFAVNTIFRGALVRGAVAGDFTGDGKADLAITSGQSVIILKGNGDGTFADGAGASIAGAPDDISQGDIDGDGDLDLAVGNPSVSFNSFHILRNDGTALNDFISPITFAGGAPNGNAVADINGDGRQDVFIGTQSAAWLVRLFTNPIGSSFISNSTRVSGFAVGDFNNNGFPDLSLTEPFTNKMRVYGGGCGIQITSAALPRGTLNAAYSFAVQQTGGTAPNAFAATGLPPGLAIDASTGVISGTPIAEGAFAVTVTLDDANGYSAIRQFVLSVGAPQIFIYPPNLPAGNVGASYAQTISADYGTAPYSFAVTSGNLPNGLNLNPNGTLSGTPGAFGTFNFTVTATDADNYTASRSYSLTVGCGVALSALPNGTLGANYLGNLTASGTGVSSFSFAPTAGNLPSGLTLNANGSFTGVPTALGTFDFSVTATAGNGCTGSRNYSVTIFPAQLKNYASAIVELGQNAVFTPAGSATATKDLTVATTGSFKGILTVNQTTGAVSVTNASPAGVYPVTVAAVDASGRIEAKNFNLTVQNRFSANPVIFDRYSPATGGAIAMALGDFNGDNRQDIVTANYDANSVSVALGAGFGSFGAATTFSSQGTTAAGVAAGDVNGDGKTDIAVVNQGSKNFAVLLGNGAGGFAPESAPVSIGGQAVRSNTLSWIAIADFNGDGRRDVAVTNAGAGSNLAIFYRNAANNGFDAAQNIAAGATPAAFVTGDFNSDGLLDIALGYDSLSTVSVFYRQAAPSSSFTRTDIPIFSPGAFSIAAGDVSGDGLADLVVGHGQAGGTSVLLNTGTSFTHNISLRSDENAVSAAVGNFDNAGKNDIVIADDSTARVRLFSLNSGNNGFTTPRTLPAGSASVTPWALAANDFNGDGVSEILFSDLTSGEVRAVWRNYYSGANFEIMNRQYVYTLSNGSASGNLLPFLVAVGDFNGDSVQDAVTANANSPTISVVRGRANGQLSAAAAQFAFSTDPNAVATALAIGDLNGDGRQDVAVGYADSTNNKLAIFYGDGAGAFTLSPTNFAGGGGLAAGDFNGDGRTDLVTGDASGARILLRNPQNTGFLAAGSTNAPTGKIKTGDFNGDGKLDFVALVSGAMTCFLGDGAGNFATEGTGSGVVDYLETGDFNGDGKIDLAGIKQGTPNSPLYVLLRNAANDGFTAETGSPYALGSDVSDLVSGDFDGDLRADLAFARFDGTLAIYTRNAGNNGFTPSTALSNTGAAWLAAADLNRDGRLDLLGATNINTIAVFLRQSAIDFDRRSLPNGSTAQNYNQTIRVGGGQMPYNFAVSGLPGGMSFTTLPDGVMLTGTPAQPGNFSVAVTVSDSTPLAEVKDELTPQAANQTTQIFPLAVLSPTAAGVSVSGRIVTSNGQAVRNAFVSLTDGNGAARSVLTNTFGYFRFENVRAGETCIITVSSKRYVFTENTKVIWVSDEISDLVFTAENY